MRKMSAAEITRKNLMDAYWLLYRKNGRGRITVKEIAETAGYNRLLFTNTLHPWRMFTALCRRESCPWNPSTPSNSAS